MLVALWTSDDGLASLRGPIRRDQLREFLLGACVFGVMASEAVLLSRWLFKIIRRRGPFITYSRARRSSRGS